MITVTGHGFPQGVNDRSMSVKIRDYAWCIIEGTISSNEFKCRVEDLKHPITPDTKSEFMVMLRLTLFAECEVCNYTFTLDKTPQILHNQI